MLRYATVLSMLLAAVSVGAVARLWLGPQGSGRYGLLLFCLIATGFFALAAWQGAASALAHPPILTYGVTGTPVYGPGVAVTLAGLALAALGLVGAFASRWRLARRR